MRCPWCGNKNLPEATTCAFCQRDIAAEQSTADAIYRLETLDVAAPEIICPNCGAHHTALAEFCSLCGTSFMARPEPPQPVIESAEASLEPNIGTERDTSAVDDAFEAMAPKLYDESANPRKQLITLMVAMTAIVSLGFGCCTIFGIGQFIFGGGQGSWNPDADAGNRYYYAEPAPESQDAARDSIVLPVPPSARLVSQSRAGEGSGVVDYATNTSVSEVASHYASSPAVLALTQRGWQVERGSTFGGGFTMSLRHEGGESPYPESITISASPQLTSDQEAGSTVRIEYHVYGANVVGLGL